MSELREYADFLREFVAAARAGMVAGKTAEETAASLKLPDRYRAYDMTNARADVQRVYDEARK